MKKSNAGTYAAFAGSEADEPRGRFGAISKATVTGSSPTVDYPAGSSWSQDQLPDEPPLGEALGGSPEPVGTAQEIAQSLLGETHPGDGGPSSSYPSADSALPGDVRSVDLTASKRRRRL